jgi:hypothetical protein
VATRSVSEPGGATGVAANQASAWNRIGRNAGYMAGAGLLSGTVLFLLDAADLLGAGAQYHATTAGPLQDQANYYVALFAHQHRILWDIIARDTVFPLAFLALIVLALAVRDLVGGHQPEAQLMVAFVTIGGILSILADLTFLGAAEYWRATGWTADPPAPMVAIGRAAEAIDTLTHWPEAIGLAILAAGVVFLGRLCRARDELPTGLGSLAYVEALLLVGVAVTGLVPADTFNQILGLATGVLIGPALAVWLGWHLGELDKERAG